MMITVTSAGLAAMSTSRWRSSGAVVPEALGLIVLPARPLVEMIRDLAQEGSGARPPIGDVVGPLAELRGKPWPSLPSRVS